MLWQSDASSCSGGFFIFEPAMLWHFYFMLFIVSSLAISHHESVLSLGLPSIKLEGYQN